MSSYDYIIVGGGPCGLTMAQLLSRTSKSILLIDAANSFGGCHRVDRVQGKYFTEHSPRIYSTSYKNFDKLLHDMGTSFSNLFTRYNFKISTIGNKTPIDMKSCELFNLIRAFFKLCLNSDYGINISMKQYMIDNKFSQETMTYIDRLCRVIDGAASDKFSLNEFLQVANQQFFYPLYQPKQPNDKGLIKLWIDFLMQRKVTMKLNCAVDSIDPDSKSITTGCGTFKYGKLVLALNPYNIFSINPDIFTDISAMYAARTRYMTYVSLSFYWNTKLTLPKVHGFSASEWGIVFIVMSDYFKDEPGTLVSLAVTILDAPSAVTRKTANQTNDFDELSREIFRQFNTAMNTPSPDNISFYPGVKYGGPPGEGGWYSISGSFFNSFQNANTFIPFQSDRYKDVYNVGCQNGKQTYRFTAIESAVTNSMALAKILEPDVTRDITLSRGFEITDITNMLILLFILFTIIKLTKFGFKTSRRSLATILCIIILVNIHYIIYY